MRQQNTTLKPTGKRRGAPINHAAPFCLTCRNRMKSAGRNGSRWLCVHCGHSFYKQSSPKQRMIRDLDLRPYCVKCRRVAVKHGAGLWRCKPCKWYASARRHQAQSKRARTAAGRLRTRTGRVKTKRHSKRYQLRMDFPQCVKCRWQMKRCGKASKPRWECNLCGASCCQTQDAERQRGRSKKIDGNELLRLIDSRLTGYSVEMREELRGEIALAILSRKVINGHRLTREMLTPATIKLIAKPIYKTQPNRFREISLDHQYGEDGQRLEERLVG